MLFGAAGGSKKHPGCLALLGEGKNDGNISCILYVMFFLQGHIVDTFELTTTSAESESLLRSYLDVPMPMKEGWEALMILMQ